MQHYEHFRGYFATGLHVMQNKYDSVSTINSPFKKTCACFFLSISSNLLRLGRPLVVELLATALSSYEKSRLKFSFGCPFPLFIYLFIVYIDPVIVAQKS